MQDHVNFILEKADTKSGIIKVKWNYGYILTIEQIKKYVPLKMSTGIKIKIDRWDAATQRVTGGNDKSKLNSQINRIEQDILIVYNQFSQRGIMPSPDQIKKELKTVRNNKNKPAQDFDSKTSIQDYMENYLIKNRIKYGTSKGHITTANKLDDYKKATEVVLYFETLTDDILIDFFNFCQRKIMKSGKVKILAINSIQRYKKDIRKFIGLARHDGIKCNVFFAKNPKLAIKEETGDGIALTLDQIKEIAQLDLKAKGRGGLQTCKDLVLIGCLTGLRFSDWGRLTKVVKIPMMNGKKVDAIKIRSRKEDSFIELPVFALMKEIYERYGGV